MCRCGCRGGWCSLFPLWVFVRWCLRALEAGCYPSCRHDSCEWLPCDELRESLAGKPLGLRGALVQIKADWCEFGNSLGFVKWMHTNKPCPFCDCPKANLYSTIKHWTILDDAAEVSTPTTYEAECARCEIRVNLSRDDHQEVLAALVYNKKSGSVLTGTGRCLCRDLPRLGLQKNDRLEPSESLMDIGQFEHVSEWPFLALVWRQRDDVSVLHRVPCFVPELGCTIDSICVDALHTMNLGVFQRYCLHSMWALVSANAWDIGANYSPAEKRQMSCECARSELTEYYAGLRRENQASISQRFHISACEPSGATRDRCCEPKLPKPSSSSASSCKLCRGEEVVSTTNTPSWKLVVACCNSTCCCRACLAD